MVKKYKIGVRRNREGMRAKRNYKDGVFRMLFNDKEAILELYNALTENNYPAGTKIEIKTLDNSIFGDIKNDLAFTIDDKLIVLIEHQSTVNPNMPVRMLCYIAKEYEEYLHAAGIYSRYLISIPAPELYVFYNGTEEQPLYQELKLSDAFRGKCDTISLDAVVKVINVNHEKGAELLKRSKLLAGYSEFIYMIRQQIKAGKEVDTAIEDSIKTCIDRGILTDFLKKNGGDIVSFLYEALTREECEAIREEDGYRRGREDGKKQGRIEALSETAVKMKEKGLDYKAISEITGLSEEEIEDI